MLQIPLPKDLSVSDHPGLTVPLWGLHGSGFSSVWEPFSSLLVVTFIGVKMACRIGYRTSYTLMCIAVMELCHSTEGSYICLTSESNGPNLLDEPLKGFIVNPADLPWKWVKRLAISRERVNHDSQWKFTTSAECKTGISVMLMVTSGLGTLTE